ncbi:hypothetical protein BKA93DRAFT_788853 [Sparassis latifolia]
MLVALWVPVEWFVGRFPASILRRIAVAHGFAVPSRGVDTIDQRFRDHRCDVCGDSFVIVFHMDSIAWSEGLRDDQHSRTGQWSWSELSAFSLLHGEVDTPDTALRYVSHSDPLIGYQDSAVVADVPFDCLVGRLPLVELLQLARAHTVRVSPQTDTVDAAVRLLHSHHCRDLRCEHFVTFFEREHNAAEVPAGVHQCARHVCDVPIGERSDSVNFPPAVLTKLEQVDLVLFH